VGSWTLAKRLRAAAPDDEDGPMSEADASSANCCSSQPSPGPWSVRFNERRDRFEHDLLELTIDVAASSSGWCWPPSSL
jgi:hypothetical protein